MAKEAIFRRSSKAGRVFVAALSVFICIALLSSYAARHLLYAQSADGFPEGFDAVQAAPASHKVVFENVFIRVVQVTLPPKGATEPMHHHRWPSLFLGYDTGGTTAHIRYHASDGKVRDSPSHTEPIHAGVWTASWKGPEPMHAIEVVEPYQRAPGAPEGWLRIEVKCAN